MLGTDWQGRIGELRQRLGSTPLLLDIGRDSVSARSELLRSGADDFWLSSAGASDLLTRLRLHDFSYALRAALRWAELAAQAQGAVDLPPAAA